jgi:hypothetical protein
MLLLVTLLKEVHRFRITSGERAQEVGAIAIRNVKRVSQTWIQDGHLFVPNDMSEHNGDVVIENYPDGRVKTLHTKGELLSPFGATLSVEP